MYSFQFNTNDFYGVFMDWFRYLNACLGWLWLILIMVSILSGMIDDRFIKYGNIVFRLCIWSQYFYCWSAGTVTLAVTSRSFHGISLFTTWPDLFPSISIVTFPGIPAQFYECGRTCSSPPKGARTTYPYIYFGINTGRLF